MREIIIIFVTSLLFVNLASGNEKFLSGALDEDKAIKELNNRMTEIKDKQEDSNVFSKGEIKNTKDTIDRIEKVRDENIGGAINNLRKTVEEKKQNLGQYYDNARKEYDKAVKKMNVIYEKQVKELLEKQDSRLLYERQKKLYEETQGLHQQLMAKNNTTNEKDLDLVAGMSEEQLAIKQLTENNSLQQKMDQANGGLKSLDFPLAIKKMEEILALLKQDIDADMPDKGDQGDLEEILDKISKIEEQLNNSINNQGVSDEDRQDIAVNISEIDQNVNNNQGGEQPNSDQPLQGSEPGKPEAGEPGAPTPGDSLQQAILNVLKKEDQAALNNLQAAKSALKQQTPSQPGQPEPPGQPGEPQPNTPPGMDSQSEAKPTNHGPLYGQRNKEGEGSDWKAKLPEKERAALLAIQKAKFTPDLELAVRKYFKELSK